MKTSLLSMVIFAVTARASAVSYDFNTGLAASEVGDVTAGAVWFETGLNSESNPNQNAARAWYDADAAGDRCFFISARSSDNKGVSANELDLSADNPSRLVSRLSPSAGEALDFSAAKLAFDAALYRDNATSFSMAYRIWAKTNTAWFAVGGIASLDFAAAAGTGSFFEADESTALTLGNAMTAGEIARDETRMEFELSSLGVLAVDQSIDLAVTLSGTRDNHAGFASSIDNLTLSWSAAAPTNHAPAARSDGYAVRRGSSLGVPAPGVLMNDTDPNGDAMTVALVADVDRGALAFRSDGSFDYEPEIGFAGTVGFSYAPTDGVVTGEAVAVEINVLAPIAVERPNILIFFADDMGIGDSRVYNASANPPPAMPTVEHFASNGMVFADAHTQAALCAPSRYSILTGNYPWRGRSEGGSWHLNDGSQFIDGQRTLGHVLGEAGYQTAIFGKGHLGGNLYTTNGVFDARHMVWNSKADFEAYIGGSNEIHDAYFDPRGIDWSRPIDRGVNARGFDYSYMLYGGIQDAIYAYFENDHLVGDPSSFELWDNQRYDTPNGEHWTYRRGYGLPGWHTCDVGPTLTRKTLDFIDAHVASNRLNGTDAPFFIHYCAQAVHSKHTPPNDFLGTPVAGTTGSAHSDMLFELEVAFSNIINKLEAEALLDDTLVIFTSDNGGLGLNESGSAHNPNEGLRGYKASIWEGGHRVPLFIKWGERIPAGRYDSMVGVHDLYATLAELVGKSQGDAQGLDAVSLLSVLLGGNSAPARDYLLCRGNSINKGSQDVGPVEFKGRALREGSYKLIWDYDDDVPLFLYDLETDPAESVDLLGHPGQAERVARMSAKMLDYVALIDAADPHLAPRSEAPPILRDLNGNGLDDEWERVHFGSTNAPLGGPLDDFDGDGLTNLEEFAYGTNPAEINAPAGASPKGRATADGFEYVYRRRHDASARNLIYAPERTDALATNAWALAAGEEIGSGFIDAEIESVTNRYDTSATTNAFFRLRIDAR